MRMTRFSRGRPDYGGGRRGQNGRFRGGGRSGSPPSSRFGRQQRRPSFEHSYRPPQQHSHTGHYDHAPAAAAGRHQHHHRTSDEFHAPQSLHQYPAHQHHRQPPHRHEPHSSSSSSQLVERVRYPVHRYRSTNEMLAQSPSVEKEVPARVSRERVRSPVVERRRTKRRNRSISEALSDISSASSFFAEVGDSDAYVSPDYDELTSEEEEEIEEEEEEVEEEILEEVVKRKKRKKDKKKKDKERKLRKKEKKRKKEILEERICPPEHEVAQSKEIFSSGKNILVSVSFADGDHEDAAAAERAYRKAKKKKSSRKKSKGESKHKDDRKKHDDSLEYPSSSQRKKRKVDENVKPVAIIDLERSPGKQLISSPKEVIVLSDEEGGNKKKNKASNDLVGPNTPPEPAPKSPESYDPFEPTKSPTMSPASGHNLGSISTVSYPEHHHHQLHHHHSHQRQPKDPLMTVSQTSLDLNSAAGDHYDDGVLDLHPSSPMDHLSPRGHFRHSPLKAHRPSPMKKSNHTPASATITSGAMAPGGTMGIQPFGEDMDDGDISPYSPRSSDCDDHMFDPPPEGSSANGAGQQQPKTIALTVDNLRKVFGNDKKTLYGDLRRPNEAVLLVDEMYKPQRVTMEMLDDMPNSAVDLQIKEKLIQKLQRQERIIEEVKHFLKPHFNKKRINKDEYKDIMKKSVPKICHSRSGEINPVKVQNLITAYVKKAIAKRRLAGNSGNAIVSSTTAVT